MNYSVKLTINRNLFITYPYHVPSSVYLEQEQRARSSDLNYMTIMPSTTLSPLHKTDGSASYAHNGFSVIGGVNGPIEVQRRDELPEEAAIDVVVRPAAGVGGNSVNPTVPRRGRSN